MLPHCPSRFLSLIVSALKQRDIEHQQNDTALLFPRYYTLLCCGAEGRRRKPAGVNPGWMVDLRLSDFVHQGFHRYGVLVRAYRREACHLGSTCGALWRIASQQCRTMDEVIRLKSRFVSSRPGDGAGAHTVRQGTRRKRKEVHERFNVYISKQEIYDVRWRAMMLSTSNPNLLIHALVASNLSNFLCVIGATTEQSSLRRVLGKTVLPLVSACFSGPANCGIYPREAQD